MTRISIDLISCAHGITAGFEVRGTAYVSTSTSIRDVMAMVAATLDRVRWDAPPGMLSLMPLSDKEAFRNGSSPETADDHEHP